jgi:hypothetical protein
MLPTAVHAETSAGFCVILTLSEPGAGVTHADRSAQTQAIIDSRPVCIGPILGDVSVFMAIEVVLDSKEAYRRHMRTLKGCCSVHPCVPAALLFRDSLSAVILSAAWDFPH